MYPVTQDFLNKIKENMRTVKTEIKINHSQGELILTDKDLALGSLTYTESSQAGEEFTIGSTVASDISFTILNKPEYDNINFMGATVTCNIGLLVKEGADAHFLQASQPSKMPGFEEKWEYVPLGRFNIDYDPRQRNTIELKAIDNMIKLDIPYSLSKLSYHATTLYQIYVNICNVADIPVGTTSFPNMDYVVNTRPDNGLTLRDVLGYVAEMAGCFARCNRNGALELLWYKPTGVTIGPANRFNFKPSDDEVRIKGIMATVGDTIYLAGSDDYAIDLTENPLLQGGYETVLPNIYNNVKDTIFTPYTSDWQGNMAIQAGDMITQIDRDGKVYNTLVTKSVYKYRGKSTLEGKGLPEISKGYKGSTDKKIAQIKRKIEIEVGDRLTTMEEQILSSTELIANMLGGYAIQTEDAFYVADNEDLSLAMKVWKWGLGGFGYSENGVNGPYSTAITADGSIVTMLLAANIVTASMVQTGTLKSEDGRTTLNLDTGDFNFRDIFKLNNSGATINVGDVATGKYVEISPNNPIRVYSHGTDVVNIYGNDEDGGYLTLGTPTERERGRFQASDNAWYGRPCMQLNSRDPLSIFAYNDNDITLDAYRVTVKNEFEVQGAKNARVKTECFGDRLLYSEESDKVYFNTHDIAKTVNNKYIIRLDEIFLETIELNSCYRYRIQLTPYADSRIWVKKVYDKYIIIESEIDCEFSYTVRCLRKGYGETYLEERTSDRYGI